MSNAATRFGLVSLKVQNAAADGGGEDGFASAVFTSWRGPMPGVTATPAFALRLRASDSALALVAGSVTVSGTATLTGVNVTSSTVFLSVARDGDFTVTAQFR